VPKIRYKLLADPMIVHACHCRDCQRITGSAFVINMWIERKFVETDGAAPKSSRLKGARARIMTCFFCDACGTYLWSFYHGAPVMRCSSAPARSTNQKLWRPTFTSSRAARYLG